MINDVIVAISTSNITAGAISLIRMSGDGCFDVLNKIFKCKDKEYEGYHIYYGHIMEDEQFVDEVLVNIFRKPNSFTGEDMVEINSHGGLFITRKILTLCLANGARQAVNGEFTKRAYLNNKIDLTQAEAVNDLIVAQDEDAAKLAMNSLNGSINKLLAPLMDDLMQIIANVEVNIDYPEYDDVGIITKNEICPKINDWLTQCDKILNIANNSLIIKEGIKTVIVGKPNVGKSSLLNALLHQDKAIVTDIAGTTRDLVEGDVKLKNVTLHLIDTAGIHETNDVVEKIGVNKSKEALSAAQLVIVVLDGSKELEDEDKKLLRETEGTNRIIVYNKADLNKEHDGVLICAKDGMIDPLIDKIEEMFKDTELALKQPALTNQRQIALMMQAKQSIINASKQLENDVPLDLVNEDFENAFRCLKEILGQYVREDLLDGIFSRFCVGK